jgi:hypothetical protein
MKETALRSASLLCLLAFILLSTNQLHARSHASARDHLTQQEADLVRETQELDKRIGVFVKAAERRLLALTNPSAANQKDDAEKLGALKGTRADFLYDLSKILDEAITNIDDVSARDTRNPLVPKSLRKLAEASSRIIAQLTPMREQVGEGAERASLETAIENAQSVLEAAGKLPPPTKSEKKKESRKS